MANFKPPKEALCFEIKLKTAKPPDIGGFAVLSFC